MTARVLERYTIACLLLDLLGVTAAMAIAAALRVTLPFGRELGPARAVDALPLFLFPLALGAWALSAGQFRLYEWRWLLNLRSEFGRLLLAVAGTTVLVASGLYLTYRDVSRLLFIYFAVLTPIVNGLSRLVLRGVLRWWFGDRVAIRIVIVGQGRLAHSLAQRLAAEPQRWPPTAILGLVADDTTAPVDPALPILGPTDQLAQVIAAHKATTVIITLPSHEHERILALTQQLHQQPVDLRVVPDVLDLAYAQATITHVEGIPLVGLRDPALSPSGKIVKYSFDRIVSLVVLIVTLPLFAIVALLIKLTSPGPVFYGAPRVGEDGRHFTMYKFRTMRTGADRALAQALGEERLRAHVYKVPDDPRITRIGRVLRRTSIDELPNLFNVLRGEMSIVGPRPEQPFIVAEYEPWQHRRTHIRPGMTGWWQVNGRGDQPMHQYTDYDLYYLENYSLFLDLRILGRTVGAVLTGRGAY